MIEMEAKQTVGDNYVIVKKLGNGGQSVVYQAINRANGTNVAIKVFNKDANE